MKTKVDTERVAHTQVGCRRDRRKTTRRLENDSKHATRWLHCQNQRKQQGPCWIFSCAINITICQIKIKNTLNTHDIEVAKTQRKEESSFVRESNAFKSFMRFENLVVPREYYEKQSQKMYKI
jgi:hypothetical protein